MNVLLIGDSIRMFYEEDVKLSLGDDYQLFSPKENCRFSSYVLNSLRFWLTQYPAPDVIHFNAGLWDTAVLYQEDGCFIGLDEYVANMKKILRVLKSTGAKLIFATTTPVSDEKKNIIGPMPPAHRNEDIIRYNDAVLDAFKDEDIYVNDLFSLMYDDKEKYLQEDMIHPNETGVKLLANAVTQAIKNCPISNSIQSNEEFKEITIDEKTIQ